MCNVISVFAHGHMPIMYNICMLVFMVTFLIAVSSYEAYILTQLPCICT